MAPILARIFNPAFIKSKVGLAVLVLLILGFVSLAFSPLQLVGVQSAGEDIDEALTTARVTSEGIKLPQVLTYSNVNSNWGGYGACSPSNVCTAEQVINPSQPGWNTGYDVCRTSPVSGLTGSSGAYDYVSCGTYGNYITANNTFITDCIASDHGEFNQLTLDATHTLNGGTVTYYVDQCDDEWTSISDGETITFPSAAASFRAKGVLAGSTSASPLIEDLNITPSVLTAAPSAPGAAASRPTSVANIYPTTSVGIKDARTGLERIFARLFIDGPREFWTYIRYQFTLAFGGRR